VGRPYPEINIAGGARPAMQGQCKRADDNELHLLMNEGIDERAKIGVKVHGAESFCDVRASRLRPVF
jgi:hypothetical protein